MELIWFFLCNLPTRNSPSPSLSLPFPPSPNDPPPPSLILSLSPSLFLSDTHTSQVRFIVHIQSMFS